MKYLIACCICIGLLTLTGTLNKPDITTPELQEKPSYIYPQYEEITIQKEWVEPFKKTYKVRYETEDTTKIIVWSWKGGDTIKLDQLEQTIRAVQERITIIPKDRNVTLLLLETAAVESSRGIDVKQKGGPARGVFQIEPYTEKYLLSWLKKNHPDAYKEVMHFYNNKESKEWNRTYNVPYSIAISGAYYWHRCGDKLLSLIETREDRSRIWKQFYNTYKGKGTVSKYHEKAEKYL